jgi:predicted ATPase/class 3 adenylate cyclase
MMRTVTTAERATGQPQPAVTRPKQVLPSGTVSLLFSDIEGSTLLLSRLGSQYLEALDGHRQVLRNAWDAHGGTEMGTEGDSFFVVFPKAGSAVSAAAQAQRGLARHVWPDGERLRVRIGIHTGSPEIHQGDYWGMDVHRAARIAGSAHGGQVVMSAVTADLARPDLPEGVSLRDLGTHQLKDIAVPEHLYQLALDDLPDDFPALRTLGAASSLPHPTTLMVGRDHDVEQLSTRITAGVRLATLSGTGGSGKTRLAIAVAERLASGYPDGVFFVPLAAVSTAEVMWTSVAESLGVPHRERTAAQILALLAHRSLLLVLDNLEQVAGADGVVARLLEAAPQVAVIATSRRPLGLASEHRHPVPPLGLPRDDTLDSAQHSDAIQLFVHRARTVQPTFELSADNVEDVVAICRGLDGLPLALELSASRIRLLSPRALRGRLGQALDIVSTSKIVPQRQRTLRNTIAWSYDLLTPTLQSFLRQLSVFAGGSDLEAIAAVITAQSSPDLAADPLDCVADLVDANLVVVTEGPDGEPRVTLMETIRVFASECLEAADEVVTTRRSHARHYADVAERLRELRESRHVAALAMAETELDNFRTALGWAVPASDDRGPDSGDLPTGLKLCAALSWVWYMGGYVAEGRRWGERVIERAAGSPSPQLAFCLASLANLLIAQGESQRASELATQSVTMAKSLGDQGTVAFALGVLGSAEQQRGDVDAARAALQESLEVHRQRGDQAGLARMLGHLAGIEGSVGHHDRAEALLRESLDLLDGLGDLHEAAVQRQNLASLLAGADRAEEANALALGLVDTVLRLRSPNLTMAFSNTVMNILIRLGDPVRAAHLFGAEEAMHQRLSIPNPFQDEELEEALAMVKGVMTPQEWNHHRRLGNRERVEDLLADLGTPSDA